MNFRHFLFTTTMSLPEKKEYRVRIPALTPEQAFGSELDMLARYLHYNHIVPESITITFEEIEIGGNI